MGKTRKQMIYRHPIKTYVSMVCDRLWWMSMLAQGRVAMASKVWRMKVVIAVNAVARTDCRMMKRRSAPIKIRYAQGMTTKLLIRK